MTLSFVCPKCSATLTAHERHCGLWPFAVDLADVSMEAIGASVFMLALQEQMFGAATEQTNGVAA